MTNQKALKSKYLRNTTIEEKVNIEKNNNGWKSKHWDIMRCEYQKFIKLHVNNWKKLLVFLIPKNPHKKFDEKKYVFIYKSHRRLIYKSLDGMITLSEKLDRRKNGMWVKGLGFQNLMAFARDFSWVGT